MRLENSTLKRRIRLEPEEGTIQCKTAELLQLIESARADIRAKLDGKSGEHPVYAILLGRSFHFEQVMRCVRGFQRNGQYTTQPPIQLSDDIESLLEKIVSLAYEVAELNMPLSSIHPIPREARKDPAWQGAALARLAIVAQKFDPSMRNAFSTLAMTSLIREARRLITRKEISLRHEDGSNVQITDSGVLNPRDIAGNAELIDGLREAMAKVDLTELEKFVLHLRFVEGLPSTTIGTLLDCSYQTVLNNQARAQRKLHIFLSSRGITEI